MLRNRIYEFGHPQKAKNAAGAATAAHYHVIGPSEDQPPFSLTVLLNDDNADLDALDQLMAGYGGRVKV